MKSPVQKRRGEGLTTVHIGNVLWTFEWSSYSPDMRAQCPHYENTPIQIYRKFYLQKLKIFR